MSGECPRCTEHPMDCGHRKDLPSRMVDTVIRLGRSQQYLKNLMETDLFINLSKHEPHWNSENPDQSDFLEDKRIGISCLQDNLWTLSEILNGTNDE